MKLIYICSPYRGDVKRNTENVKRYCRWAQYDGIPIAPHLYFTQFLDEDFDRWRGMSWGKYLMQSCSTIWILCDELTEGMVEEIEEAKKLNLKMRFFNEDRKEITHANYLIHPEIGPGFRRVIAEYYGDSYALEGCADCGKCGKHIEKSGDDSAGKEPETEPEGSQPERRSIWDRIRIIFCNR